MAVLAGVATGLASGLGHAQSLLLGGTTTPPKATAPLHEALPRGALRRVVPRPEDGARWCSERRPVCVHVAPSAPGRHPGGAPQGELRSDLGRAALGALERAYEALVLVQGHPPPAADASGSGDELDWYLWRPHPPADPTFPVWADDVPSPDDFVVSLEPLPSRGFDRAAAFCAGGATDLDRAAHLCVAEASLAARAPAAGPHVRRAYGTHLWWQSGRPHEADGRALRRLQDTPEVGVLSRRANDLSEGAAIWFEYLETLEAGQARMFPRVATAALHLAATRTAPGAIRWHGEPDVADVLRSSLGDRDAFARFWDGFARHRALAARAPEKLDPPAVARWTKEATSTIPARPAWELTTSSLPRHLALPHPLQPTGSAFFVLEVDRPIAVLALRATCEKPVSYVWSVARLDSAGRHLSTLHVPFKEAQPVTEQRIMNLEQTRYLLISGTNLGGVDLAHPFDPDHDPFEPHGCSVYFAPLGE